MYVPCVYMPVCVCVCVTAAIFKDFDNGEEAARLRQVDDEIDAEGVERYLLCLL